MPSPIKDRLRSEALALAPSDRADLAHDLVQSLDGPVDSDSAGAWEQEILRRIEQLDAGSAPSVDRKEFTSYIREQLRRI